MQFENDIRNLLSQNRILKNEQSSSEEVVNILEDFLDKNRRHFNEIDIKNNLMEKKIRFLTDENEKLVLNNKFGQSSNHKDKHKYCKENMSEDDNYAND